MKSIFLPLIVMTLGQTALASLNPKISSSFLTPTAQQRCFACEDAKTFNSEIFAIIREMNPTLVSNANSEAISGVNNSMGFATKCANFATDEEMGAWGDAILKEFARTSQAPLLHGTNDIISSCPRYRSLRDGAKQAVWVMIMNAMAHLESSCRTEVTAKGPNGNLIGLLQLHKNAERRYAPNCRNGDGNSIEGTFRCGMSMLSMQLKNREALFARMSYWDVLRPQAKSQKYKKIMTALTKFSLCR